MSVATISEAACDSGIGKVSSKVQLLQIIAQLESEIALYHDPELIVTPDAIMERACTSGIAKVSNPIELYQIIAQLLDDQQTPPAPPTPPTPVFSGAIGILIGDGVNGYSITDIQTSTGFYAVQESDLTITTYANGASSFAFGNTDIKFQSCVSLADSTQSGDVTVVNVSGSLLVGVDVSALTALNTLNCYANSLTALDVSTNTALTSLECGGNAIATLDVSANTALTELGCNVNSLSALSLTTNTALTALNCSANSLTTLDLSANTLLTVIYCDSNSMIDTEVDAVLCAADAFGTPNGTLGITTNAVPTAAGLVCAANLVLNGWFVSTD